MKFPKPERVEDKAYLDWIETLGCICCGRTRAGYKQGVNDAHHVNDQTGGSAKKNDRRAVPMCWGHHREFHQIGIDSFARKYDLNYQAVIDCLNEIYSESRKLEGETK